MQVRAGHIAGKSVADSSTRGVTRAFDTIMQQVRSQCLKEKRNPNPNPDLSSPADLAAPLQLSLIFLTPILTVTVTRILTLTPIAT